MSSTSLSPRSLLLVLSSLFLAAACGGGADETTSGGSETRDTEAATNVALRATITGAVTADLETWARFNCQQNMNSSVWEFWGGSTPERFRLDIPFRSEAGTYELVGSGNQQATGGPRFEVSYHSSEMTQSTFDIGTGELVLEQAPAAAGERFSGRLTAQLENDDGDMVEVSAEFDTEAGSAAFEGCEQ